MMAAEAKTEQTYNPWSFYMAESIGFEAEWFSVRRRLEFMEAPATNQVYVKSPPPNSDRVEVTVTGRCHDPEGLGETWVRLSFELETGELGDDEKERALRAIGTRYSGSSLNHRTTRNSAARALGMPRFFS